MSTSPPDSVKSEPRLAIYFPVMQRTYDWFADLPPGSDLRAQVLHRQHECRQSKNPRERYAHCTCTEAKALFVVRATPLSNLRTRFCLARFPRSGPLHAPHCFAHDRELPADESDQNSPTSYRLGDLAALAKDFGDPEAPRRTVAGKRSAQTVKAPKRKTNSTAIKLGALGNRLFESSGICTWHPWYAGKRGFREVNGLMWQALRSLQCDTTDPLGSMLAGVAMFAELAPWSVSMGKPSATTKKVLGFGFVSSISPPTPSGSRTFTLASPDQTALLVPADVLAAAARNPNLPATNEQLKHPTWVLFVAGCYDGVWKAHELVGFRLSKVGLIPVVSDPEEAMVEHLISCGRSFKRLLLPPEHDFKYVPDFVLTDTVPQYYIEVAGRTDEAYLRQLEQKRQHWKGQVIVWHARDSFPKLPHRTADSDQTLLPEEIPSVAPQLPVEAERPQAACT